LEVNVHFLQITSLIFTMKTFFLNLLIAASILAFAALTSLHAQTEISGTITDQFTREALSGARILVKGTKTGTVATSSGKFTLKSASTLAAEDILTISMLGYKTKHIAVSEVLSGVQVELAPQVITSQQVANRSCARKCLLPSALCRSNLSKKLNPR
jgi:CarboxypepD_reg-like domain